MKKMDISNKERVIDYLKKQMYSIKVDAHDWDTYLRTVFKYNIQDNECEPKAVLNLCTVVFNALNKCNILRGSKFEITGHMVIRVYDSMIDIIEYANKGMDELRVNKITTLDELEVFYNLVSVVVSFLAQIDNILGKINIINYEEDYNFPYNEDFTYHLSECISCCTFIGSCINKCITHIDPYFYNIYGSSVSASEIKALKNNLDESKISDSDINDELSQNEEKNDAISVINTQSESKKQIGFTSRI